MRFFSKSQSVKAGLSPGALVPVATATDEPVRITVMQYDPKGFKEWTAESVDECLDLRSSDQVTWIHVDGLHDLDLFRSFGREFGIHALTLEDIVNTDHRPKAEDMGDYVFITLKMMVPGAAPTEVREEQVSLVLLDGLVISFMEREGEMWAQVRERVRRGIGRLRQRGPDYLAYVLVDAVVDQYFIVLENLGQVVDDQEERLLDFPESDTLQTLYDLRRKVMLIRKNAWPLREMAGMLRRGDSDLILDSTQVFLGDLYDHVMSITDMTEILREMVTAMLELYMNSVNNRMSDVMRVLTVIATIFIPLTFIAGVYGMNFKYMPELEWRWGYVTAVGGMLAIGLALVDYFRRKKWF